MPLVSPFAWCPRGHSETAADEKAATNKATEVATSCTNTQGADHAVEEKAMTAPTIDYSAFLFLDDFFCDMMMCFPVVDTTTDHKNEPLVSRATLRKYTIDSSYSYSTYSRDETLESHHQQHGALQVQ